MGIIPSDLASLDDIGDSLLSLLVGWVFSKDAFSGKIEVPFIPKF